MWSELKCVTGICSDSVSFESIARMWLCDKKFKSHNAIHAVALWILWNTRNDMCFNRSPWPGFQCMWRRMASLLSQWKVLFCEDTRGAVESAISGLEHMAMRPPLL